MEPVADVVVVSPVNVAVDLPAGPKADQHGSPNSPPIRAEKSASQAIVRGNRPETFESRDGWTEALGIPGACAVAATRKKIVWVSR